MSTIVTYNKSDLPNCIDEIKIGSEINCILEDETRIYGKLLKNNTYNITMQQYGNKLCHQIIEKSFIKELRLYIADDEPLLELGDIVEIINVDGLNRVIDCKKGNKNLIGLQGKITMIDKISCSSIAYYLVDLPIKIPRVVDMKYTENGRAIFLAENLKLVKKENYDKVDKKEEDIYLDKEIGIRKDYLYKITIEDVGTITGEILNFNGCTYVIKSYKEREFNHYIVKYKNILDLHPIITIEQYNKKVLKL